MKPIAFDIQSAGCDAAVLAEYNQQLQPEIARITAARGAGYTTDYASINLPDDEQMLVRVLELVAEKKVFEPSVLVVIGIGGSSLGTRAVHEALNGMYYNEQFPDIKFYCVETVDSDNVWDVLLLVEQALEMQERVLVNVISKSGSTTETIANYELCVALLKNYWDEAYRDYVIITTDEDSKLWHLGQKDNITCLPIPKHVGGRYSVFSAVGLFPLAMLGVDIRALCAGARDMVARCCDTTLENNPAALSAAIIAYHYRQNKNIHDTFLFSVDLEGVGRWYRQLMGESIGKERNRAGDVVHVGMTPTVSIGSTDLHSVGQLYLGGPHDKFTTFITVEHMKSDCVVPVLPQFESLVANIQGRSLVSIMEAIVHGVQKAYRTQQVPFVTITIPEKSSSYIGQLLQCKMLEMMYLGFLLEVNPFDQPHVENYKQETRKILAHE